MTPSDTSRPLRIGLVTAYDLVEAGGVKKHVMQLAAQLRARGDEVTVLGPYSGNQPLPPGTHGFRGVVNIRAGGSHNHLAVFARPWKVQRVVHRGAFDVLHVHEPCQPSLGWYATWFARDAARVATFHAHVDDEAWVLWAARRLCRPQLSLFHRAIAVSAAAADYARPYWPGRLELVPNGVDTRLFRPTDRPRERGPVRLLFVGQWRDPRKGFRTLLEAYQQLRARKLDVVLDVVGHGDPRLRLPAAGLTYHGHVDDDRRLAELYRQADIFIAPSVGMESFGMVLLEAMACGKPVVCSDIAGYRDVAPRDAAQLVPPADAMRLAQALEELAADQPLCQRMGLAGRQAALPYDWAHVATRVRETYLEALAEIGRRASGFAPSTVDASA